MWIFGRLAALVGGRVALWGAIVIVGLLATLYAKFWSSSATLKKVEVKEAVLEAAQKQEAKGLLADYRRIDKEPHQTAKELLQQLNDSARRLRHKP